MARPKYISDEDFSILHQLDALVCIKCNKVCLGDLDDDTPTEEIDCPHCREYKLWWIV